MFCNGIEVEGSNAIGKETIKEGEGNKFIKE